MTIKTVALKRESKPVACRDTVMISHANPEDNEFTLWLALQLTREGYKVWSDITDFVGGEQFWSDIEHVIRYRAAKFIYVLSRTSNESNRGFRKELHLADSEARKIIKAYPRFILPVAIDDLRSSDYNVYLQQLNCIRSHDWSSGLHEILKRLRKDKVLRFRNQFNPSLVSDWWRRFRSAKAGLTRKPDRYFSNWFPIESLPTAIYWHTIESNTGESPVLDFDLPFNFVQRGGTVLTFATESEFRNSIGKGLQVVSSDLVETTSLFGAQAIPSGPGELNPKFLLLELLRSSWDDWIGGRGLGIYELANRRQCAFFKPETGQDALRVPFTGIDGLATWRSLIGTFSRHSAKAPGEATKHYWHFGVQAKPRLWPHLVFHLSAHVLFSDNAQSVWESKRRLHSARRRQCKSWYNDEWRDRLLAAMAYLGGSQPQIAIPLSESQIMRVSTRPLTFESKITCKPLSKLEEATDDADLDDDDTEIDEDNADSSEARF
jgi:hypothetical protein